MAIYTTELLTDRDYNIPEGRLPLEYAVDQSNKAKTHSENAEVHVTAEEKAAWNAIAAVNSANSIVLGDGAGVYSESESTAIVIGRGAYADYYGVVVGNASRTTRETATVIGNSSSASYVSVAVGANASASSDQTVVLGAGSSASAPYGIAVGKNANVTGNGGLALGNTATASAAGCSAVGYRAESRGLFSTAIGTFTKAQDDGIAVIGVCDPEASTRTRFYLIGANTPLATTYENGEACLGYVVSDTSGNVLAAGTRKLSELLTNNTTFAPASLDPEAEPPKVFLPAGATDPIEEPKLLAETVQEATPDPQQ